MATLRELKNRLRAVKNTQKITKAMKMVAASKLRRSQEAIIQARPFAIHAEKVLQHLVATTDISAHPLMAVREPRRIELVVMTSNRGLCGSFNSNILRASDTFLRDHRESYESVQISTIGKKAREHVERSQRQVESSWEEVWNALKYERAQEIANTLTHRFSQGKLDAIYLVYNEFKSAISQKVVLKQLLPLQSLESWEEHAKVRVGEMVGSGGRHVAGSAADLSLQHGGEAIALSKELDLGPTEGYEHVYEPSRTQVLDLLLPQYVATQIWRALLESTAAEHGARMSAMDAASRNAKDLIGSLTLQANRVRQTAITNELMEIVSGAEALNG